MEINEESAWLQDYKKKEYPPLTTDIVADVAIIGAGLTGITTAYTLSKTDKRTVLIEKADITSSVTAYTTAFITYVIDTSLTELVNLFGKEKAKLIWRSHKDAIDEIASNVKIEKIDCEFLRCNEYIYAKKSQEFEELQSRQQLANKLGFSLNLQEKETLQFANEGSLEIPNQGKFHPIKYALSIREKAIKNGVLYFEKTQAKKLRKKGDKFIITTDNGSITAHHVVIATYNPFNNPSAVFAKKGMYTTFVLEGKLKKGILEEALFLDMENPYHYIRIDTQKNKDKLIIGGEDHRSEIPYPNEKAFDALEKYLEKLIPQGSFTIERKWPGPILEPTDGLALIGELSENLFLATAFSGNGMTYAHIAATMFSDLIHGKQNVYENIYDPTRIPSVKQLLGKGRDYIEEFFGGAVKDLFTQ